ncbi:hypothetical protein GCM10011324_09140 [Allosediminivita pacifica]|nr:hypothetical protein GCM10011324_09140 [Allosediminivita pacifica]
MAQGEKLLVHGLEGALRLITEKGHGEMQVLLGHGSPLRQPRLKLQERLDGRFGHGECDKGAHSRNAPRMPWTSQAPGTCQPRNAPDVRAA